jgi:anti-anti-sigma factor
MEFTITSRFVRDVVILDLSGKFSLIEHSLKPVVDAALSEGRRQFLINLAGVPYIGSWGITQIISAYAAVVSRGGAMELLAPTNAVRNIFVITGLEKVFTFYEDEAEAVRHLSKSASI